MTPAIPGAANLGDGTSAAHPCGLEEVRGDVGPREVRLALDLLPLHVRGRVQRHVAPVVPDVEHADVRQHPGLSLAAIVLRAIESVLERLKY